MNIYDIFDASQKEFLRLSSIFTTLFFTKCTLIYLGLADQKTWTIDCAWYFGLLLGAIGLFPLLVYMQYKRNE